MDAASARLQASCARSLALDLRQQVERMHRMSGDSTKLSTAVTQVLGGTATHADTVMQRHLSEFAGRMRRCHGAGLEALMALEHLAQRLDAEADRLERQERNERERGQYR